MLDLPNGGICMFRGCLRAGGVLGVCPLHCTEEGALTREPGTPPGLVDNIINQVNALRTHYANNPQDAATRIIDTAVSHLVPGYSVGKTVCTVFSEVKGDAQRAQAEYRNGHVSNATLTVVAAATRIAGAAVGAVHIPVLSGVASAASGPASNAIRAQREKLKTE